MISIGICIQAPPIIDVKIPHQLKTNAVVPDPRLVDASGYLIEPSEFTSEQVAVAGASRGWPAASP